MTFILITMLGSNFIAAAVQNPLDLPDYLNDTDGSHNIPVGTTLQAGLSYTTDKVEYLTGDVAQINMVITSIQGDKDANINRD